MDTYPLVDKANGRTFAFEIDRTHGLRTIVRVLSRADGVTGVRTANPFEANPFEPLCGVHVQFQFRGQPHEVWEPHGGTGRYWIGPTDPWAPGADIRELEDAFRRYQPPLSRQWFGDLATVRFLTRFCIFSSRCRQGPRRFAAR